MLLLGAADHFLPHKDNFNDIPAEIVSILMTRRSPEPSWAAPAAEAYASLTDRARRNVLALLAAIGDRPALTHYIGLLKQYRPPAGHPQLAWPQLRRNPRHGGVVFPDLLAFAFSLQLAKEVLFIVLAFLEKGTFPGHASVRLRGILAQYWSEITANAAGNHEQRGGVSSDRHQELRALAELVLDVCGRVAGPKTERIAVLEIDAVKRRINLII